MSLRAIDRGHGVTMLVNDGFGRGRALSMPVVGNIAVMAGWLYDAIKRYEHPDFVASLFAETEDLGFIVEVAGQPYEASP